MHARSLLRWKCPDKLAKINQEGHKFVWGDVLPLFREETDLRIINLETSVTTHDKKWPNKAFNYRMHPENLKCLKEAKIDYCSLANNHTLDFGYEGMRETIESLKKNNIEFAGAGENSEKALQPALVESNGVILAIYSFSDHPVAWRSTSTTPGINFLDFSEEKILNLQNHIKKFREENSVDLVVLSLHWGSNYSWKPPKEFQIFAYLMIDNGVDIIHGHSSHHVQGIQIYKGKPIIYGCGDFIDDYAIDEDYRNDLGFAYVLNYNKNSKKFEDLELVPTQIDTFSVTRNLSTRNHEWLFKTFSKLSGDFGTTVKELPNSNFQILFAKS